MTDKERDFLNEEDEIDAGGKTSIVFKIIAVIILLSFLVFSVPNFAYLLSDRLNFLDQSKELNQDEIVLNNRPAVVAIEVSSKDGKRSGTGFNIDPSGLIITNEHVVEGAVEIIVEFSNGRKFFAKRYQEIEGVDVALIEINGEGLPAAILNKTDPIKTGETVTIIGNPLNYERVSQRGKIGKISSISDTKYEMFEIKVPINPGNSGSPVINGRSEVVGIVYAGVNMQEQSAAGSFALAVAIRELPF